MLDFLESMKESVLERPDGDLTLGRRYRLWDEVASRYPTDACLRRAALGYVVCADTIAVWESLSLERTDERLHHHLRALCRSVLVGELGGDAAREQFTRLDCHAHVVESVLIYQEQWKGASALRAVWRACLDVIRPVPLRKSIDLDLTDADIDPDDHDPHFLTSCVIAGGAAWEPSSHLGLRRTFWINWLEKLFPLAFSEPAELLTLIR